MKNTVKSLMILPQFSMYFASMSFRWRFLPSYAGKYYLQRGRLQVIMEVITTTSPTVNCECGGQHTIDPPDVLMFETLCCQMLQLKEARAKVACLLRMRDVIRTGKVPV